jgi:L-asparaginase
MVALNGEVNAAREVTKTDTYRLHTFRSRELGLLGYADADKIVFYRKSNRSHTVNTEFDVSLVEGFPRVSVLYVHTGVDDALVHAAVKAGAKGLVLAGTGAGAARQMQAALAEYARKGIVVVRASRVGAGRVVRNDNWQAAGFVAADNLSPQKAWVLLTLGLAVTSDPDRIQSMFDKY